MPYYLTYYVLCTSSSSPTSFAQAGLTVLDLQHEEWEWKEEATVTTLEHVGFGNEFFICKETLELAMLIF